MGCIYEDRSLQNAGDCTLCDENDRDFGPPGQEGGICVCSDDPDPSDSCDSYESDYVCHECGADLNVVECTCDEG